MKRPPQWEVKEFIADVLGISLSTPRELIEVVGKHGFEFYMIAFHNWQDTQDGPVDDVSIAVFWPKTEKAPAAGEQIELF